ncbi:MAG: hypothetical protein M1825_000568 [Sarcosagium campestre]|nr:MAG: hypothetical protein M1825_000568 [Sarcosagium campestre]
MPPKVHNSFEAVTIHTAKCDICNARNKAILQRCTLCGWSVCQPCWQDRGTDGSHMINVGDSGWTAARLVGDAGQPETMGARKATPRGKARAKSISNKSKNAAAAVPPSSPTAGKGSTSKRAVAERYARGRAGFDTTGATTRTPKALDDHDSDATISDHRCRRADNNINDDYEDADSSSDRDTYFNRATSTRTSTTGTTVKSRTTINSRTPTKARGRGEGYTDDSVDLLLTAASIIGDSPLPVKQGQQLPSIKPLLSYKPPLEQTTPSSSSRHDPDAYPLSPPNSTPLTRRNFIARWNANVAPRLVRLVGDETIEATFEGS